MRAYRARARDERSTQPVHAGNSKAAAAPGSAFVLRTPNKHFDDVLDLGDQRSRVEMMADRLFDLVAREAFVCATRRADGDDARAIWFLTLMPGLGRACDLDACVRDAVADLERDPRVKLQKVALARDVSMGGIPHVHAIVTALDAPGVSSLIATTWAKQSGAFSQLGRAGDVATRFTGWRSFVERSGDLNVRVKNRFGREEPFSNHIRRACAYLVKPWCVFDSTTGEVERDLGDPRHFDCPALRPHPHLRLVAHEAQRAEGPRPSVPRWTTNAANDTTVGGTGPRGPVRVVVDFRSLKVPGHVGVFDTTRRAGTATLTSAPAAQCAGEVLPSSATQPDQQARAPDERAVDEGMRRSPKPIKACRRNRIETAANASPLNASGLSRDKPAPGLAFEVDAFEAIASRGEAPSEHRKLSPPDRLATAPPDACTVTDSAPPRTMPAVNADCLREVAA